jgi:two-component system response regulator HydG
MARILVADSLPERRNILCTFLRGDDHLIYPASSEAEAVELTREVRPDLIVVEGDLNGMKVLTAVKEIDSHAAVILILATPPPVEEVVKLMNQGVNDFLVSPLNIDDVRTKVERALSSRPPSDAVQIHFRSLAGSSLKIQQVFQKALKVAVTDSPVLILGERGTGKQALAREMHDLSFRKDGPFNVVHCSGLSPAELESELFGHEPGAFSWAAGRRRGQLELGDGGTVFLDQVGELSAPVQAKLLRFLEERTLKRLGGDRPLTADVRILAATCQRLGLRVQEGTFRQDLFFRLSTNQIELPPLRARVSDIPELVDLFLAKYDVQIAGEAMTVLMNYSWPGNVDELRAAVEQAVALCDNNRIELKALPQTVLRTVALTDRRHKFIPRNKEAGQNDL